MPTYGMLIITNFDSGISLFLPLQSKIKLYVITLVFTCLLPVINVLFLLRTNFITSVHMEQKEERRLSYIATLIFFASEFYLLNGTEVPALIKLFVLGAGITVFAALIVNFFWKISIHMIGIGGLIGIILILLPHLNGILILLPLSIIAAGLIGYSRLALNAHVPAQVYAGFLVGLGVELLLFGTMENYF